MGASKPIGTQGVGSRVDHRRVEAGDISLCLGVAVADLVTQAEVHREIRAQLPVVLNEHLRLLETYTCFGIVISAPVGGVTQKEICIFFSS